MAHAVDVTAALKQIDEVLDEVKRAIGSPNSRRSQADLSNMDASRVVTLLLSTIERLSLPGSTYSDQARKLVDFMKGNTASEWLCEPLLGLLHAMRADFAAGRLVGIRELLHAELFGDFLDAAQHLLDEGYKDPAAVIAGASLEAHIRKIADKHGVDTMNADGSAKKTSLLTAELAKTTPPAILKNDSKNITAWLGIRNDAAHGDFGKYTKDQVALLIQSVRDFITRVSA